MNSPEQDAHIAALIARLKSETDQERPELQAIVVAGLKAQGLEIPAELLEPLPLTDDRPQWWKDAEAAGLISHPEFDPTSLPEHAYMLRVERAEATKNRVMAHVVCRACQRGNRPQIHLGTVYDTAEGPLYCARTQLDGKPFEDIYHEVRKASPKGVKVEYPSGGRRVLLEVSAPERPLFSGLGARCRRCGPLAVPEAEILKAIDRFRVTGKLVVIPLDVR
jgi:hypothetical protein